jgi:transcriptional regulator with XRE-family HTH domain
VDLSRYVGPAIRSFRLEAELSQEELAARADLDRTYISGVERGRRNPTVETLQSIVHALGIGLDSLFGRARELANSSVHATRKRRGRSSKKR